MPTIGELITAGKSALRPSDTARIDAELLLCHIMNSERTTILSHPDRELPQPMADAYHALLGKRAQGQPIAYLTGHREFWSLDLHVNEHTLIPRPETECLVESALDRTPPGRPYSLLDLGTGSGAVAIVMARERPRCRITATDIHEDTLAVAVNNAQRHELDNIRFILSDWFTRLETRRFDMIVCNPPYVRCNDEHLLQGDVRFEPADALSAGIDGLVHIRMIIDQAPGHLVDGGWLLLEHGYDQGVDVRGLFAQGPFTEIMTGHDYSGHERITGARHRA